MLQVSSFTRGTASLDAVGDKVWLLAICLYTIIPIFGTLLVELAFSPDIAP